MTLESFRHEAILLSLYDSPATSLNLWQSNGPSISPLAERTSIDMSASPDVLSNSTERVSPGSNRKRSPHCRRLTTTGKISRPFSVRKYYL